MKNKKTELLSAVRKNMEVQIGFPGCVRIDLVQVNELRHYEMFNWLTSLFIAAAVGFWVAYITTTPSPTLLVVSFVFSGFTLLFGGMALYYRRKLDGSKITKVLPVRDLH